MTQKIAIYADHRTTLSSYSVCLRN